ncbi:MAG: von Willebrand factor type A domain-containing protein [Gammaproteobacteria bacterium]
MSEQPVSTFSIDRDTGAYANVRRFLNNGRLPLHDAVRVEEMINYFDYDYPPRTDAIRRFQVTTEIAATPWNRRPPAAGRHQGLRCPQGPLAAGQSGASGRCLGPDGIPRQAGTPEVLAQLLTRELVRWRSHRHRGLRRFRIGAGTHARQIRPPPSPPRSTVCKQAARPTARIQLAYATAHQVFIAGGINRVILATDGDFNVGTVDFNALKDMVADKRKTGIALTTLGFGTGNYNDQLMEQFRQRWQRYCVLISTI